MSILIIALGAIALIGVLAIYTSFSWGFVTSKFWEWFILPVFPSLPHLDLYQCIGLFFFISLFQNHSSTSIKKELRDDTNSTMVLILAPWITFLVGYLFNLIIK